MTKRERVEKAHGFGIPDRPPFVPAVYEHKAALLGRTPSKVCRDAGLLREALLRELEIYDPDVLTVGIDVYNVEAEALGCRVRYFEDSNDVPAVASPLLRGAGGADQLEVPDPESAGRMPLFLDTAGRLGRELGSDVPVRGAVSGPFSLACALLGTAEVLVGTSRRPRVDRETPGFLRPGDRRLWKGVPGEGRRRRDFRFQGFAGRSLAPGFS